MQEIENSPGVKVTTAILVSGVGDQAAFLAGNGGDIFYVLYGHILFDCFDYPTISGVSSSDAFQESALQQCAQLVVSRLDP